MSNASEYADSLIETINANDAAGSPFGIVSDETPVLDRENGDEIDGFDYLQDALDIQYIVSGDREYRGARVLVAFGGPNAWLNTLTGQLEVSWWSAPEYRELPAAFTRALNDALEDLWRMGA
jgi:hypothetical protein